MSITKEVEEPKGRMFIKGLETKIKDGTLKLICSKRSLASIFRFSVFTNKLSTMTIRRSPAALTSFLKIAVLIGADGSKPT